MPTAEQWQVIRHAPGKHAKVMAVAGSGKTSTMVLRIRHLVEELGRDSNGILVLMYNRLAREDFNAKLRGSGMPEQLIPSRIHTFHSYANSIIQDMQQQGVMPQSKFWDGRDSKIWILRAIEELGLSDAVDPEEALNAVGLWKGSLITPDRAGYKGNPEMPNVYKKFEQLRARQNATTFDDWVAIVVNTFQSNLAFAKQHCNKYDFVIVDEYQDINYGQEKMLELVAGARADVMVVGDDDQTIYEWRGARPQYILKEFERQFSNKPCDHYDLSFSFRFGPAIAQSAMNSISMNKTRAEKRLIAHNLGDPARILVVSDGANQPVDVDRILAEEVVNLLQDQGADPAQIVILARMFVQLSGLEAEFLRRKIPYFVLGASPFFARPEIEALLDYIRVANDFDTQLTADLGRRLAAIANSPNRGISAEKFTIAVSSGVGHVTPRILLDAAAKSKMSPFTQKQRAAISELHDTLERTHELIFENDGPNAGALLQLIVSMVDYQGRLVDFHGDGETAADRMLGIDQLIRYSVETNLPPLEFVAHVSTLDPTQGRPLHEQIMMTTIFKTKGLEYDYVIIPHCEEGYMPCLFGTDSQIFDTAGIVSEPPASDPIENERRLFYVALTRARRVVFLGFSDRPRMGFMNVDAVPSRFIEETCYESVHDVLPAVQRFANGDIADPTVVRDAVKRWAHHGWIGSMLVPAYVERAGSTSLRNHIHFAMMGATAKPFTYSRQFGSVRKSVVGEKPEQSTIAPSLLPKWLIEHGRQTTQASSLTKQRPA
jgi:DNA helicase-2/ATP-dependent DNA helicase PcrA